MLHYCTFAFSWTVLVYFGDSLLICFSKNWFQLSATKGPFVFYIRHRKTTVLSKFVSFSRSVSKSSWVCKGLFSSFGVFEFVSILQFLCFLNLRFLYQCRNWKSCSLSIMFLPVIKLSVFMFACDLLGYSKK